MSADTTRVRLTPDELAERAQRLAGAVRAVELLEQDHTEQKQAMAAELKSAKRQVRELAEVVRTGVEDRSVQLDIGDAR